ncbi:hypothetical protein EII20_07135 [Comamonadaceae bacterium OH2545_COT-014]|nr:hypothetical protein EII20_07135 [Comamonadaceae bacterium OH2545_COT-014]
MAGTPWKKETLATAAMLAVAGFSLDAHALALGAITVRSSLGEPLRAEIEVPQISSAEAASLKAALASPQAFRAAGVDYTPAVSGMRVTLHRRANGQAYLRLAGSRPVNEPFLGVVVEASWANGRVVRDYTMLIDPPGRDTPPPVTVTGSEVPVGSGTPSVAEQVSASSPEGSRSPEDVAPTRRANANTASRQQPRRAAAPSTGGGQQITVRRGDTAYGLIASHVPEGVSLDQMLVALLRANPNAFIRGNVNLLKSGAVVHLPTAEQASAVSRSAARRAVVAQSRDFQAYRRGLAGSAPRTAVASADRSASGSVQAQVRETRPAPPTGDRLRLTRGSAAKSSAEAQIAQNRQAQEQSERMAELSKNIDELKRLQNASAAAAGSAAVSSSENASSGAGIPVPVGTTPVAPPVVPASGMNAMEPAPAPVSEQPSVMASAPSTPLAEPAATAASETASAALAATTEPAPAPVEPPPPPPPPAPPPEPVAEPSFVDSLMENPLIPATGLGLLALLAGYGFYRSRQVKKNAPPLDSSFIESRLQPDSFFGASGGQRVNTKDAGNSATGANSSMAYSPSQLDAAGDVDPVAEADVYLAYGRDMQAEEILKEALRTHPTRVSVHRKLAEIYAKRRDAKALEAIATEAYPLTNGQGADWDAICVLGGELDPDNGLYKPGGKPQPKLSEGAQHPGFGADTEPQTAQIHERKGQPSVAPVVSSPVPLDLDLDLDNAPVKAPEPAPMATAAATTAAMSAAAAAASAPAALSPATTPDASLSEPGPLDFDLDLDAAHAGPVSSPAPVVANPPAAAASTRNSGMIEFDMDALSLDPDSRGGDLRTEQPEDADDDPLSTKLALAKEFHAIGDTEGARMMVKEVVDEASGSLKARAERFLNEIS